MCVILIYIYIMCFSEDICQRNIILITVGVKNVFVVSAKHSLIDFRFCVILCSLTCVSWIFEGGYIYIGAIYVMK